MHGLNARLNGDNLLECSGYPGMEVLLVGWLVAQCIPFAHRLNEKGHLEFPLWLILMFLCHLRRLKHV